MTGRTSGVRRPLGLAALVLLSACRDPGPPQIEIACLSLEPLASTSVPAAGGVAARFSVRNVGGRDLLIHGVIRDCGCELVSSIPDTLSPRDAAVIDVACRAPVRGGSSMRELRVRSNDPVRPVERLSIPIDDVARAASPVAAVYFGYVPVGGSATREIAVDATTPGLAAPTLATASDPAISIEAKAAGDAKPNGAAHAGRFVLHFTPTAAGPVRAQLDLGGGVRISASGVGYRGVLAYPAEIELPSATKAGGLPPIALKGVGEEPLEIIRLEFPPGLAGDLHAVTPGHEYRMNLRGRSSGGSMQDAIRIHTASATEPVLTIPVRQRERS